MHFVVVLRSHFFYHTVPKYFKRIDRQKICLRQNILNRDCMELKRFHNCKNGCSLWQKYQRSVSLKEYIPSSFKWRHTYLIYLSIYYFTFRPIQLARKSLRSNKQGKEYNRFFSCWFIPFPTLPVVPTFRAKKHFLRQRHFES